MEKVTLIAKEGGRTNHDKIFIDRAEQLKGLDCDVIYTVPISLVLSNRASDLMEIYGCLPHVLPMVMTETRQNAPNPAGMRILGAIVGERFGSIEAAKTLALENEVFENLETLERLCLMSGGHVRNLVLLVQTAIKYNEEEALPIQASALEEAIRQVRKTYRDTVSEEQWDLLASVHQSKQIPHDTAHHSLLFTRCLLEYREGDSWYDVHPVLREVPEFVKAYSKLSHTDPQKALES